MISPNSATPNSPTDRGQSPLVLWVAWKPTSLNRSKTQHWAVNYRHAKAAVLELRRALIRAGVSTSRLT